MLFERALRHLTIQQSIISTMCLLMTVAEIIEFYPVQSTNISVIEWEQAMNESSGSTSCT